MVKCLGCLGELMKCPSCDSWICPTCKDYFTDNTIKELLREESFQDGKDMTNQAFYSRMSEMMWNLVRMFYYIIDQKQGGEQ